MMKKVNLILQIRQTYTMKVNLNQDIEMKENLYQKKEKDFLFHQWKCNARNEKVNF